MSLNQDRQINGDNELPFNQQNSFDFRQDELFSMPAKDFAKCRTCHANKDFSAFTIIRSKNRFGRIVERRNKTCKSCRAAGWRNQYANDAEFKAATEARQKKYLEQRRTYKQRPHGKMKRLMQNWFGRGRFVTKFCKLAELKPAFGQGGRLQ